MAGENSPMQEYVNALRAGEYIKTTDLWDIVVNSFNFAGEKAIGVDDFLPALIYALNETDFKLEDITALSYAMYQDGLDAGLMYYYTSVYSAAQALFMYRNQLMTSKNLNSEQAQSFIIRELDLFNKAAQLKNGSIVEFLGNGLNIEKTTLPVDMSAQESDEARNAFYKKNESVIDENILLLKDDKYCKDQIASIQSNFETEFKGQKNTSKLQAKLNDRLNKTREELDNAKPERLERRRNKAILLKQLDGYKAFLRRQPPSSMQRMRYLLVVGLYNDVVEEPVNSKDLVTEINDKLKFFEDNTPGRNDEAQENFYQENYSGNDQEILLLKYEQYVRGKLASIKEGFELEFKDQGDISQLKGKLEERLSSAREELDKSKPEILNWLAQKPIILEQLMKYINFLGRQPPSSMQRMRYLLVVGLYNDVVEEPVNSKDLVTEINHKLKFFEDNKPGWDDETQEKFYQENDSGIVQKILLLKYEQFVRGKLASIEEDFELESKEQGDISQLEERLSRAREELDKPEILNWLAQSPIILEQLTDYANFLNSQPKSKTQNARYQAVFRLHTEVVQLNKVGVNNKGDIDNFLLDVKNQLKVIKDNKPGWREGAFINAIVNLVNHFRANKRTTAFAVKAAKTDNIISSLNDFSAVDANDKVQSSAGAEFESSKEAQISEDEVNEDESFDCIEGPEDDDEEEENRPSFGI